MSVGYSLTFKRPVFHIPWASGKPINVKEMSNYVCIYWAHSAFQRRLCGIWSSHSLKVSHRVGAINTSNKFQHPPLYTPQSSTSVCEVLLPWGFALPDESFSPDIKSRWVDMSPQSVKAQVWMVFDVPLPFGRNLLMLLGNKLPGILATAWRWREVVRQVGAVEEKWDDHRH